MIARLFILLSGVGLFASAVSSVFAWLHRVFSFEEATNGLCVITFMATWVVGFAEQTRAGNKPPHMPWSVLFRGCPTWFRKFSIATMAYAALCCVVSIALAHPHAPVSDPVWVRHLGEAGVMLVLQTMSFGLWWSRLRAGPNVARCENGHWVMYGVARCPKCGIDTHASFRAGAAG